MSLPMMRVYRDRIEKVLHEYLKEKHALFSSYSSIHNRFYTNLMNFIQRGGKRLRPILMVIGYNAVNPTNSGDIYKAACSVELLHTSTLIHDDLVDRDEMRRGGPTFHAEYRNQSISEMSYDRSLDVASAMAILGGNISWNLGLNAILESEFQPNESNQAIAIYSTIFSDLVNGVMFEEAMSSNSNPNEVDYLLMVAMKTSSLISNALKMGAVLGRGSESQTNHLNDYGLFVGQAFQIRDDILGTYGKWKDTGKSADADILWGKKTLLSIHALNHATPSQNKVLKSVLGNRKASENQVEEVREIFNDTGAHEYCNRKCVELITKSQTVLNSANPSLDSKTIKILRWISDFSIRRKK